MHYRRLKRQTQRLPQLRKKGSVLLFCLGAQLFDMFKELSANPTYDNAKRQRCGEKRQGVLQTDQDLVAA